ncbi:BON domain-containing protein [Curtobacterium sp. JUb34]|uniref:BON domain-containing protein n=1 Tax=Curtobacterium sp. JUb34 TaxID=2485109 RepID=UPI000F47E7DF|nr:BON domain-containing protein [Curtobacterium sp. JUb34]
MTDDTVHHRPDADVKSDVEEELDWTPGLEAAGIGVAVEHGVGTLTGQVGSHAERVQAGRAALRVTGVRGLAEELGVRGPNVRTDADADLRRPCCARLRRHGAVGDRRRAGP